MAAASFSASAQLFQQSAFGASVSRKLLTDNVVSNQHLPAPAPVPVPPAATPPTKSGSDSLDSNVLLILSVLVCGCFCSLGLHFIIRCLLRCSTGMAFHDNGTRPSSSSGGSANKGVRKKALKTFPVVSYSPEKKLPGLDEECVICLSEFENGELLRILPKCNHGFHIRCIDKWLKSHSSCPKCRQSLIETCKKIVNFSQVDSTSIPVANSGTMSTPELTPSETSRIAVVIETLQSRSTSTSDCSSSTISATQAGAGSLTISIEPLEPEGRVNNFREAK